MDKNFMDKFNFIFSTIQSVFLLIAVIVAFVYVAKFSYILGEMKDRIHVLELQNPIEEKGNK